MSRRNNTTSQMIIDSEFDSWVVMHKISDLKEKLVDAGYTTVESLKFLDERYHCRHSVCIYNIIVHMKQLILFVLGIKHA